MFFVRKIFCSARKNYNQNSYAAITINLILKRQIDLPIKVCVIHISFSAYEHPGTPENSSCKLLHSISSWVMKVLLFSLKACLLDGMFSTFQFYLQFYMLILLYNLRRKLVSKVTWMIEQFLINCWLSSWRFCISSLIINLTSNLTWF